MQVFQINWEKKNMKCKKNLLKDYNLIISNLIGLNDDLIWAYKIIAAKDIIYIVTNCHI